MPLKEKIFISYCKKNYNKFQNKYQGGKYMENLFIIMICTGGFGLLLCLGVGIQKTGSKALKWFRRFRL